MLTAMDSVMLGLLQRDLNEIWLIALVVMVVVCEVGYRIGRFRAAREKDAEKVGGSVGTLIAGMLSLLAFTLGLTINFAQSRYEARRDDVVLEANTIGTAWYRAQLVGGADGEALASAIVEYTRVRLAYARLGSEADATALLGSTNAMQTRIWALTTTIARAAPTPIAASLIASVNDMIDASLVQRFALESRVPARLMVALFLGSILSFGAMGFQFGLMGYRQIVLTLLLLLMWSGGFVLIADFSNPRTGGMRVNPAPLIWTLNGFLPP